MKNIFGYILILVFIVSVFSCEKDFDSESRLIGEWKIMTPDRDTIVFENESSFIRKYNYGIDGSFEYSYTEDSITIQYRGPNMILVQSSTHFYRLKNKELHIDFSNGCYGFSEEIYTLARLE